MQLFHGIGHSLHLRADHNLDIPVVDDLHAGHQLADGVHIHLGGVLDTQTQTGHAVLDVDDIGLAAKQRVELRGQRGVLVAGDRGGRGGAGVENARHGGGALIVNAIATARGLEVELLDHEREHEVVDDRKDQALHDKHPRHMRLRHTQREEPIDEAGGEVEAGDPLEGRGDEHRQGGEQRVHHVQREGGEHEGELQGLGHTGEEGGQTTGEHQGA